MMHKIKFSESLGLQLKEFRTQYQIKGKDVASLLGKSPAYISKLEKGQIRQIEKKELVKITNFISQSEDGYILFCEKIAEKANLEELEHNILLLNFDLMERRLPVNKDIIDIIKDKMEEVSVSAEDLSIYINQNEDLGSDFFLEHKIDATTIEKNTWLPYQEADSIEYPHSFIILEYKAQRIEDFLNGNIRKCEYMFPYAMLYHLLKLQYKRQGEFFNDFLIDKCKIETEEILSKNKFYSLSVQARFSSQSTSEEEYKKLLSKFDIDNMEYVSELLDGIEFLSKYDIEYTNSKLKNIVNNFKESDLSFSLAFMAIPLISMKDLQPSLKREFLNEVNMLVQKYASMTVSNENIEKY